MPRDILNIEKFNRGLVTVLDSNDISPDAASASTNIEPKAEQGKLLGRKEDVDVVCAVDPAAIINALIRNDDATVDLIYSKAGTSIRASVNFPSGADSELANTLTNIDSMVVHNREVRVGCSTPKWVGRIGTGQFGGAAPSGIQLENAEIQVTPPSGHATLVGNLISSNATDEGTLDPTNTYFYKFAIEFDGYQLGPLMEFDTAPAFEISFRAPNAGDTSLNLRVEIIVAYGGVPVFTFNSPRFSAVHLFRAQCTGTTSSVPSTAYSFVARLPLASGWTSTVVGLTTLQRQTYIDKGEVGSTYENITGLAPTLTTNFVNYRLAAMINGSLLVGRCTKTGIDDASHMLFRSQTNRPDMFNWIDNFVKLPTIPVALASFGGRAYAFDAVTVYRVNVDGLFIEDQLTGVGAVGARAVLVTELGGMFIADTMNAYMHDGRTLIPIGDAITPDWQAWVASNVCVVYHKESGSILFIKPGATPSAYVFNLAGKRWDYWSFGSRADNAGVVTGKDGELYLPNSSTASRILHLCASSTRKAWSWISGDLSFDDPSQVKKIYALLMSADSGVAASYVLDGAAGFTALSGTSLPDADRIAKTIRVKLEASATDKEARSLSVVFRRMVGKR